ncbi:MAG: ion transporter [Deltaproteobacteria bacterium]|jgi:voltage-gated potassium channel
MSLLRRAPARRRTLAFYVNHPVTDFVVMVLIIASVVLLVFEETMPLTKGSWIVYASDAITVTFAVELTLRLIVAKKKARFFRRYWPDLLALLPLLRPLRFFRFFRLLRLFRLFQLGLLLDRRVSVLRGVLRVNFYFLWILVVLTVILVVGSAVMAFVFEHRVGHGFDDLSDNLWWAAYTIIAGEPIGGRMPTTDYGRLLLAAMMLSGMTLFAIFTGVVSATMIDRLQGTTRLGELDIEELEDHIIICGWNDGGEALVGELTADEELSGRPILLVNEREEMPDLAGTGVRPDLVYHLEGDFTQIDILARAGVERAHRAVVLADDTRGHLEADRDARSVLAALTIERMKKGIYCVVELMDARNEAHLAVAGVEAFIMRNDLAGRALASACRHPRLIDVMMNLLTLRRGQTLLRLPGPKEPTRFGSLLSGLKAERGALLIGVELDHVPEINPPHDLTVTPEHHLLVISDTLPNA